MCWRASTDGLAPRCNRVLNRLTSPFIAAIARGDDDDDDDVELPAASANSLLWKGSLTSTLPASTILRTRSAFPSMHAFINSNDQFVFSAGRRERVGLLLLLFLLLRFLFVCARLGPTAADLVFDEGVSTPPMPGPGDALPAAPTDRPPCLCFRMLGNMSQQCCTRSQAENSV